MDLRFTQDDQFTILHILQFKGSTFFFTKNKLKIVQFLKF